MQVDKTLAMSSPYLLNDKFPCKYEILDAKETKLSDETPMITLKLRVTDKDGKSAILRAWLKWNAQGSNYYEIGEYCVSSQMESDLENGELKDSNCIGKKGDCLIKNITNKKSGLLESQIKKWLAPKKESTLDDTNVLWG